MLKVARGDLLSKRPIRGLDVHASCGLNCNPRCARCHLAKPLAHVWDGQIGLRQRRSGTDRVCWNVLSAVRIL